jgi:hypothetical protein
MQHTVTPVQTPLISSTAPGADTLTMYVPCSRHVPVALSTLASSMSSKAQQGEPLTSLMMNNAQMTSCRVKTLFAAK